MDNERKYKRFNDFKLFKQFLIDNGCYHLYMFNVINRHKDNISYIFDVITSRNVYNYINGSFAWCFTKERYDYWYEIDNKWQQFISKLYIKT